MQLPLSLTDLFFDGNGAPRGGGGGLMLLGATDVTAVAFGNNTVLTEPAARVLGAERY
jgi:hypothetical protein